MFTPQRVIRVMSVWCESTSCWFYSLPGWAHVVCALYIPEVRFGNVTTMEPIILASVPHDRFLKVNICWSNAVTSKFRACGIFQDCYLVFTQVCIVCVHL